MNVNSTMPGSDRGNAAKNARIRYAQALAGLVTMSDEAPSLVEALEEIETTMPNASDGEVYRETFMTAAEAISGDDASRWHLILLTLLAAHGQLLPRVGG